MSTARPFLSVVMPAHRGTAVLRESLPALLASDLPRSEWELIVVDDASGDPTPDVAAEYADRVIRLEGRPRGPAFARNRGVEASRGTAVVFIDADVCVHPPALRQMAEAFHADPRIAAVFGSYDAEPRAPGIVSRFRNLLHHHVHQMNPGPAETFWAGCGAVRRDVLLDVGMYDEERYPRPQIEDIELGRRLRRAGHRIELRPDIQCTHLKRWTLHNMTRTDFLDRGVPWMRLLLSEGPSDTPATLNLRIREKVCTALVAVAGLALLTAIVLRSLPALIVAAGAILMVIALNHRFYRLLGSRHGILLAAAAVPLHVLFYVTAGSAAVVAALTHHAGNTPPPQKPSSVAVPAAPPAEPASSAAHDVPAGRVVR
ncbi:MAG TPA: glycosyltransferase family 2 protein [Longimicrobiales bacterium]|nr:glycosyltransferase family 2 protein [Longimicrobiales bacterium]